MPLRGKIPPLWSLPPERWAPGGDAKMGIKDAIFVNVHKEQKTRWRWVVDLLYLGKVRGVEILTGVRIAIYGLAQVVATRPSHRKQLTILGSYPRHIGRAAINPSGAVVWKQHGTLDVLCRSIEWRKTGTPGHIIVPAL